MNHPKDSNTTAETADLLVWLFLVILIVCMYFTAESSMPYGTLLIVFISTVKFLLVGCYFMETRFSHIAWKLVLVFFITVFSLIVIVLG